MAVSKDAGRALSLITGIETCKEVPANFWSSAVTRIVLELDERALDSEVAWLAGKLGEWWNALPGQAVEQMHGQLTLSEEENGEH